MHERHKGLVFLTLFTEHTDGSWFSTYGHPLKLWGCAVKDLCALKLQPHVFVYIV